jgi:hypothetical protein
VRLQRSFGYIGISLCHGANAGNGAGEQDGGEEGRNFADQVWEAPGAQGTIIQIETEVVVAVSRNRSRVSQ